MKDKGSPDAVSHIDISKITLFQVLCDHLAVACARSIHEDPHAQIPEILLRLRQDPSAFFPADAKRRRYQPLPVRIQHPFQYDAQGQDALLLILLHG